MRSMLLPSFVAAVTAVMAVTAAPAARAELPSEGWPQSRRDAALTGRSDEPALPSARLRWILPTDAELSGEPVVSGCMAHVTSGSGTIHAVNSRSGALAWTYERAYAIPPDGVASALAIDGATLLAGLPVDPLLQRAFRALPIFHAALESYAIDYNTYPPGPELAPDLTPTYLRSLPPNPITGSVMVFSATPSPGDYRYELMAGGGGYLLGIWGSDGGLLHFGDGCAGAAGDSRGLAPGWPVSAERGGSPVALDAAGGGLQWLDLGPGVNSVVVPTVGAAGPSWATQADRAAGGYGWWGWWWGWWRSDSARWQGGTLQRSTPGGARAWEIAAWGGARGGTAHDAAGNAYLARGPAALGGPSMALARTLATACESYAIDNNAYPPSGDLADDLVPLYLPCMPPSLMDTGPLTEGPFASGGDYEYVSADPFSLVIRLWDEEGGILTEFDTGSFTVEGEDRPPSVASFAADGAPRWRRSLGLPSQDLTPVLLADDGSVVVGTSGGELLWLNPLDGSERGRVDTGEVLSLAPALLADGGVVVVGGGGTVVAHAPDRSERWRLWLGSPVVAPPSTTADGVTYVGDLDGNLTAISADGTVRWRSYLGGPTRAGLTTTPVPSGGWLYVGRSDGALLAVVPRETGGRPPTPVPLLATGEKSATTAGFTWEGVPPATVPGAHWHLLRWRGSLAGSPADLLAPHPSAERRILDVDAAGALLFYSVHLVDCAEIFSF